MSNALCDVFPHTADCRDDDGNCRYCGARIAMVTR